MYKHSENFHEEVGDTSIEDDDDVKRFPLLMVPKDNKFDPRFPANCYRMGKYVTVDEANQQQNLEYMSKTLYDLCIK